jgi:hypothetical protein
MKTERTKYDDENPFYWLLIFCFFFWFTQWVDSRPTHFKPRRSSHVTTSQYGR